MVYTQNAFLKNVAIYIANIAIVLYGHREKHSDKPYSRLKLISVNPD